MGMTAEDIREANRLAAASETLSPAEKTLMYRLIDEVRRLRQGLWDCVAISGADTDGQLTPDALVYPDLVDYAKREVGELRDEYDLATQECE